MGPSITYKTILNYLCFDINVIVTTDADYQDEHLDAILAPDCIVHNDSLVHLGDAGACTS